MTINTHTFPNGFRIATESIPNFKTVALGIWIKVGGRHETKDQNGIAHFLEHMAFKGTNARTSLDIAEALENSISTSLATHIYVAPIALYKKRSSSRAGFLLDSSLANEG